MSWQRLAFPILRPLHQKSPICTISKGCFGKRKQGILGACKLLPYGDNATLCYHTNHNHTVSMSYLLLVTCENVWSRQRNGIERLRNARHRGEILRHELLTMLGPYSDIITTSNTSAAMHIDLQMRERFY